MKRKLIACITLAVLCASVLAGIPVPDAVIHGSLGIEGQPAITATSDVTVIARVPGVANPVGVYRMGDSPTAGDSYILRIRLEHATSASPVASDVAQVGQTVQVFMKEGNGPEEQMTTMLISEIGILEKVNLCRGDSVLNLSDAAELAACPSISPNAHCPCADVNGDGQVDMRDWAQLQNEFSGA